MTKTQYEIIAKAFVAARQEFTHSCGALLTPDVALEVCAGNIADKLGDDNPSFNRVEFLKACGISTEE